MASVHESTDTHEMNSNSFSFFRPKENKKMGPFLPFEGPADNPVEWKWDDVGEMWRPRKIRTYEPYTMREEVMIPKYQFVKENKSFENKPRGARYEEVCWGDGTPCENPEKWSSLSDWNPPGDTQFPALHMDFKKEFHRQKNITFWDLKETRPYVGNWMLLQRSRCQEEFHKYGRQHVGLQALPGGYDTVSESNLRHPATSAAWSVLRANRTVCRKQRKEEMIKHFDEIFGSLLMQLDFTMRLHHTTIAIEVTPVAEFIIDRLEYGWFLYTACGTFAFITFCLASPNQSHPGIFLYPAVLTIVCAYQYSMNYSKNDPTSMYVNWVAWHNTPKLMSNLDDFGVPAYLFRQEQICIIQRDTHMAKKPSFTVSCSYFVSFIVAKTFYAKLKIGSFAFNRKWEIIEPYLTTQNVCSSLPTSFWRVGSLLNFEFDQTTPVISKICISCAFVGFGLCCVRFFVQKYFTIFSDQFRERKRVGECIARGVRGERRYRRLGEVLYWVFRRKYPEDPMGQLDRLAHTRLTRSHFRTFAKEMNRGNPVASKKRNYTGLGVIYEGRQYAKWIGWDRQQDKDFNLCLDTSEPFKYNF